MNSCRICGEQIPAGDVYCPTCITLIEAEDMRLIAAHDIGEASKRHNPPLTFPDLPGEL